MPKASALESLLSELRALRDEPGSSQVTESLRRALKSRHAQAVATATGIVGARALSALSVDLVAAFDRFLGDAVRADPGCRAKTAIAKSLDHMEYDDEALFLKGLHHRQAEPVWGGTVDTACELRGTCAMALVRMNYADVLLELAELLVDPEPPVRVAAAQAIAYHGGDQGQPLLRLKVLSGDGDPVVIAECFGALLRLGPTQSLPFVARFLDAVDPATVEAAALALGESRLPEAFGILRRWWETSLQVQARRTALLAIAVLRHQESLDFLLNLIRDGPKGAAEDAVRALALYREEEALRARVLASARARRDLDLRAVLAEAFQLNR